MVCSVCIVHAVISGSGLMPAEYQKLSFKLVPRSGDLKADFEREITFVADKVDRDGPGYTAKGKLHGDFGVFPQREDATEPPDATMDAFVRKGRVQFVKLEVSDGRGGIRFLATFQPAAEEGADGFRGTAYMSRVAERRRRRSRSRPVG